MTFHLNMSIVTIGPLEPAFLISLVVASLAAWFLGRALGRLTALVRDPWRRRLYVGPVWIVAACAFFVLPNAIVTFVYPAVHPDDRGAIVCVAMVWPTFALPAILAILAALRALQRNGSASAATPV